MIEPILYCVSRVGWSPCSTSARPTASDQVTVPSRTTAAATLGARASRCTSCRRREHACSVVAPAVGLCMGIASSTRRLGRVEATGGAHCHEPTAELALKSIGHSRSRTPRRSATPPPARASTARWLALRSRSCVSWRRTASTSACCSPASSACSGGAGRCRRARSRDCPSVRSTVAGARPASCSAAISPRRTTGVRASARCSPPPCRCTAGQATSTRGRGPCTRRPPGTCRSTGRRAAMPGPPRPTTPRRCTSGSPEWRTAAAARSSGTPPGGCTTCSPTAVRGRRRSSWSTGRTGRTAGPPSR